MSITRYFLFFLVIGISSCYRVPDTITPRVNPQVEATYLSSLTASFPKLSVEERSEDWGKEYLIGLHFAKQLDLYRAVSTFKRARILVSPDSSRLLEIDYLICLCYYLGKKYGEMLSYFEQSELPFMDASFAAYQDLLILLYESYLEVDEKEKAEHILYLIQKKDPKQAEKLHLSATLIHGDIPALQKMAKEPAYCPFLSPLLSQYHYQKKSVFLAQTFNAVIPGAGYYYVGLKRTAFTAFVMNSLFIYASYYFFQHGPLAAAILTTSFEMGWYFGGIYGAGERAKIYNERLYEVVATPYMNEKKLFPVLMLRYGF